MDEDSNFGDTEQTMKPEYKFEWFESREARERGDDPMRVRSTADLSADSAQFREAGVERLAQYGRADPECNVSLVGFVEV
jgi:hypothetical protein